MDSSVEAAEIEPRHGRRRSLLWRATFAVLLLCAVAIAVTLIAAEYLEGSSVVAAVAFAIVVPLGVFAVRWAVQPALAMFRALAGTVASYRDGDFAFSLAWKRNDELGELVDAHNRLGDTLRSQRLSLVERELLLDTMIQNTPVAMLLFGPRGHVVYANLTARKFLNGGQRMEGTSLDELLAVAPEPLREAIESGGNGLFTIEGDDDEEIYSLARRGFRLNGREHQLFVLRHLTNELRRQEVRTWKKVIRVISHELNNSLAPIASLAHSGGELVRRSQTGKLDRVFETIAERAKHLESFINGYARFAKLPAPRVTEVAWTEFFEGLRMQVDFAICGELPSEAGQFDQAQLEQAMVNLLRNAHESGSEPSDIRVRVVPRPRGFLIEVSDRGRGMSESVLENALLPFYSTKRGGTGLGLALVREIIEAHGGRVSLANRDDGGFVVSLVLP